MLIARGPRRTSGAFPSSGLRLWITRRSLRTPQIDLEIRLALILRLHDHCPRHSVLGDLEADRRPRYVRKFTDDRLPIGVSSHLKIELSYTERSVPDPRADGRVVDRLGAVRHHEV